MPDSTLQCAFPINSRQKFEGQDLELVLLENFLSPAQSNNLFEVLLDTVDWRQDEISLYGKRFKIPRLQAWYGDVGAKYQYSGLSLVPSAWLPELWELKQSVEQKTGNTFNSVLLNLYRDGHDSMGWHSDNERELGDRPNIVSISLGAVRRFGLRHRDRKKNGEKAIYLRLQPGSMVVMSGDTQSHWEHCVPKMALSRCHRARINLTFRLIRR